MRLDQTIANRFDAAELATLAAEIDVARTSRFAAQPEPDGSGDATALLVAAVDRGRAAALLAALAARAPDVDWAALPWPPAALAALHNALDRRLALDDLRDLCLRLGVDYDSLPGEGKRARARELVLAMERQSRTAEVSEAISREDAKTAKKRRGFLRFAFFASSRAHLQPALLIALVLCLLARAGWQLARGAGWAGGGALPEGVVGVAVAEFAETADCRGGARGREASALVYATLARELDAAGLGRRVALARAGRVCSAGEAAAAGARLGAEVVVWGWLPATADGLYAGFTLPDPAAPASADLARSFEALISGPDDALSFRLSGRVTALSRFLLGLVHAREGDYAAAEALYGAAVAGVEDEMAAAGSPELRRTLAVLLTERGKARAALGRPAEARADYARAEALNPEYLRLLVALAADRYLARDWDAAEAYLDRADLQDEPLPTLAYGYGLLDYYRGRFAAAVARFDRAIALSAAGDADASIYHLARGYAYAEWGDCAAAAADFAAVLARRDAPAQVRQAAEVTSDELRVTSEAGGCGSAGETGGGGAGETAAATTAGGRPPTAAEPLADATNAERPTPNAHSLTTNNSRLTPLEMAAAALVQSAPTPPPPCTPAPRLPCAATATPQPLVLLIGTRGANVRQGPGAEYPVLATRRAGAELEALAVNPSGECFQVRVPGQGRGWVAAAYVEAVGNYELGVANYESGGGDARATADSRTPAPAAERRPPRAGTTAAPSPSPLWTPPGSYRPTAAATATAPVPAAAPTRTPAAPPAAPTPTLLPPPTARSGEG